MGRLMTRAVTTVAVVAGVAVSAAGAPAAFGAGGAPVDKQAARAEKLAAASIERAAGKAPGPRGATGLSRLAAAAAQGDGGLERLAVTFRARGQTSAADLASASAVAKGQGGRQRHVLRRLGVVTIEVPKARAEHSRTLLRGLPGVERVETVPRRTLSVIPNDEYWGATAPYLEAVTAPSAWDIHKAPSTVNIAVVDTGVDAAHPDLFGRVTATHNAVDGTGDVTDVIGHGTFVAGVAAATANNGIGIAGASFGASVMAVKVADAAGDLWTDNEVNGVIWAADNGAQVINLSLGGPTPTTFEADAIAYAQSRGVTVVAAAGNDGVTTPSYPAAYPDVIAVGATDAAGGRAPFSQYGPWVTVGAPGVNLTSTAPTGGSAYFAPSYDVASGTSFSTPLVAAQAALLRSLRPDVTAADVRTAIVASAHGYLGLGLGAGQVDFAASYAALRPGTKPTITSPGAGTTVKGVVTVTASSNAAQVRFSVDGVVTGAPVPVSFGAATTTWTTWGLANGPHTVTAVDCSAKGICNTAAALASVTLGNQSPVITAPSTSGQVLGGSTTVAATAPGGAVAFLVDNVRKALDATAPYAVAVDLSALADGSHTLKVVSCNTLGTVCNGPSASVAFTARSLHPSVVSVSPVVLSPNGDKVQDTTRLTFWLPEPMSTILWIKDANGTVVRGPVGFGTLGAGTHTWTWNGLVNSGTRAASGLYRLQLTTSKVVGASTLRGSASGYARVDLVAPTFSSVTGSGATFYPTVDGYADNFVPAFNLNEASSVTFAVRTGAGTLVRSITASKTVGRSSFTWNGRNTAGTQVAGGTYYWTLSAKDAGGNVRTTARFSVVVSSKRLVARTATLVRTGSQAYSYGGSEAYCDGSSKTSSDFYPTGLWLLNVCDYYYDGLEIVGASYRFTMPAAVSYTGIRIDTYGNSFYGGMVGSALTRWGTTGYTFTPYIAPGMSNAWRTLGTVSASGVVSSSRYTDLTLFVTDEYSPSDYDIGQVRLIVGYKVLA